ncbi:hypothetical protein H6G13_14520 [Pseudanabaena sp. FACHB-2040]|nr:hypothetical protein [Pseudanabaena sp. FACHB-2040]
MKRRVGNWRDRILAVLALVNLGLVAFDATYLKFRNFYRQELPGLAQLYDPVKGIRPHAAAVRYEELVAALQNQLVATGVNSPEVAQRLADLRSHSTQFLIDNPLVATDQGNIAEKIKAEIRQRTGTATTPAGFARFWSQAYLAQTNWPGELAFWNEQINPRVQTAYFRDSNRWGLPVNYFWLLDWPFILIFLADFLIRTRITSQRNPRLDWLEAMLRRWYDLLWLLPVWRWLRLIPTTVRLYEARLLNLEAVRSQVNHDVAVNFAQELMELIGIQVIDQMQASIRKGDLAEMIFHPEARRPYVQVNGVNEVQAIASRIVNVGLYDVVPQVQSDIEALLTHSLTTSLSQIPLYSQLKNLPGIGHLPSQWTEQLARELSQATYQNVLRSLEDPVAADILERLSTNFRETLEVELQKRHNLKDIQDWLVDMLEEFKINYVQQIADAEIEQLVEKTENLHYSVRSSRRSA